MAVILNHIEKTIKGAPILKDINLELNYGVIYGLKGKNGSGKTMLMRVLCGLVFPTKGFVEIDGAALTRKQGFPPSIGALIETPAFLSEYSGKKNLQILADLQASPISESEIEGILRDVGLDSKDTRAYKKYSLGMKQRLGIAAAIMGYPKIVVLDEPTNALDVEGIALLRKICATLKAHHCMVLLSCHDPLELEELSDYIITLQQGEIVGMGEQKI